MTRDQYCALYTIRNGVGTNKLYKKYIPELKTLQKYGLIELEVRPENPIISQLMRYAVDHFIDIENTSLIRHKHLEPDSAREKEIETLKQKLKSGEKR